VLETATLSKAGLSASHKKSIYPEQVKSEKPPVLAAIRRVFNLSSKLASVKQIKTYPSA
jgi:hypothetical protein